MTDTQYTHDAGEMLQADAEMTPARMEALRTNLNAPDAPDYLRLMALAWPEFAAYVGTAQAKEWEASYDAQYLEERYEWASRLIVIVIDLDLHRTQLQPALFEAFEAAWERAYGDGDSEAPSELERRAGIVQMLGILADAPGLCQGLAAALRAKLLEYDREVWEAI